MTGKVKILMVIASTGIGGAEMFALNVVRNIDHKRFHIDFVVNFFVEGKSIEQECRSYGCEFFRIPSFRFYNYFNYWKAWNDFFMNHQYNIVYAHSTSTACVFLKNAKKYGMKTIAHSHSAGYRGTFIEQMVKKYFARKVGKVADFWFACSDLAAERLYGNAYKNYPHYYCIPNAINTEKYIFKEDIRKRIRDKYNICESTFVCGHVGSFTVPKNHFFLVDVFEEVIKIIPDSKLLCCGGGGTMASVKAYARSKNILDKIVFVGIVDNVNEHMMAMDAFVFPSVFEGFPISVLEAESSGLPVVMSDIITSEVNLTDLICRCSLNQTPKVWAERITKFKSAGDRKSYNDYIANSAYNIKTAVRRFEELYLDLIVDGS